MVLKLSTSISVNDSSVNAPLETNEQEKLKKCIKVEGGCYVSLELYREFYKNPYFTC